MIDYLVKREDKEKFIEEATAYGYNYVNNDTDEEVEISLFYSNGDFEMLVPPTHALSLPIYSGDFTKEIDGNNYFVDEEKKEIKSPMSFNRIYDHKINQEGYSSRDEFKRDIEHLLLEADLKIDKAITMEEIKENFDSIDTVLEKVKVYKELTKEKEKLELKQKLTTITDSDLFKEIEEKIKISRESIDARNNPSDHSLYFIADTEDLLRDILEKLENEGYRSQHQSTWKDIRLSFDATRNMFLPIRTGIDFSISRDWKVYHLHTDQIPIVINPILKVAHFTVPTNGSGIDAALSHPQINKLYYVEKANEEDLEETNINDEELTIDLGHLEQGLSESESNILPESLRGINLIPESLRDINLRRVDSAHHGELERLLELTRRRYRENPDGQMTIQYLGFVCETVEILDESLSRFSELGYTLGLDIDFSNNTLEIDTEDDSSYMLNSLNAETFFERYTYIIVNPESKVLTFVSDRNIEQLFNIINPLSFKKITLY